MQLLFDLRYVFRLLRKTPSFTLVTLLVIVLGLTLYICSYSVAQVLTDKPMPFANGERYVSLKTLQKDSGIDRAFYNHDSFSYNYLRDNVNSFSTFGGFTDTGFALSDGDYSSVFFGSSISPELISATGTNPLFGRVFSTDDSVLGAPNVVLIGYTVWQDYYGGRSDVVGMTSRIGGQPYSIIGVMPEGFKFPMAANLWLPFRNDANVNPAEGENLTLVAILKENTSEQAAETELNTLMGQLALDYPEAYANRTELVRPYASIISPDSLGLGTILTVIALLILALAVINLSALLFIRSSSRQQELAVRASVGANGWELAKQILLESFVICFSGLLASLLVSELLLRGLNGLFLNSMEQAPFWFDLRLDAQILAVAGLCTLVVWLASCLATALKVYRSQPMSILNTSGKGAPGIQSRGIAAPVIVGIEVVLSFFLLISCGVSIYIVQSIEGADYGISTDNYLIGEFNLAGSDYASSRQKLNFLDDFGGRLTENPEINSAAIVTAPVGLSGQAGTYELEDRDVSSNQQLPSQEMIWLDDGYFDMIGIQPVEGRIFDGSDSEFSKYVVVLSQDFAQQLWPDSSAVGRRIKTLVDGQEQWLTVVGVVPHLLQAAINIGSPPSLYRPISQDTPDNFFFVADYEELANFSSLEQEIRGAITAVDRSIPIENLRSLDQQIAFDQGAVDAVAYIFVAFSFGALILASTGIYGVIARTISLKTHEIGVRRALGSSDMKVLGRYLRQGFIFLLVGAVLGGGSAYIIIGNIFSSLDAETGANALNIIAPLVVVLLALMIAIASYLPARKAISLEPGDALRYE